MMSSPFSLATQMPKDPLMAQAWVDCLRWAISEPDILARFMAETGKHIDPRQTPIERLVSAESGANRALFESFVLWFGPAVWGESDHV
jgi:hypothetical protein